MHSFEIVGDTLAATLFHAIVREKERGKKERKQTRSEARLNKSRGRAASVLWHPHPLYDIGQEMVCMHVVRFLYISQFNNSTATCFLTCFSTTLLAELRAPSQSPFLPQLPSFLGVLPQQGWHRGRVGEEM